MTPEQIELGRHALGLPNRKQKSYRNYFTAGTDHNAFADWVEMVSEGNATRSGPFAVYGGDCVFTLTRTGALLCLLRGESLDLAYFRE